MNSVQTPPYYLHTAVDTDGATRPATQPAQPCGKEIEKEDGEGK